MRNFSYIMLVERTIYHGASNPGDLWNMSGKVYAANDGQAAKGCALLDLLFMTKELAGDVQAVVAFTTVIMTGSLRL